MCPAAYGSFETGAIATCASRIAMAAEFRWLMRPSGCDEDGAQASSSANRSGAPSRAARHPPLLTLAPRTCRRSALPAVRSRCAPWMRHAAFRHHGVRLPSAICKPRHHTALPASIAARRPAPPAPMIKHRRVLRVAAIRGSSVSEIPIERGGHTVGEHPENRLHHANKLVAVVQPVEQL